MTKLFSQVGDNGGLCECCNSPATKYAPQGTYPVYMGGYSVPQRGTFWVCHECKALLEERDRGSEPGKGSFTDEQRARLDALGARR